MQFGVLVTGPYAGEMDPASMYQEIRLQARAAANNFDALFTAQHYLSGPAAAMMQPLVLLSNLAAEAPGLHLGTALFLLPLHHPVSVAEQTATLDIISGGKFLFGVGQGYRDLEFNSFGLRRQDRRGRMAEGVELVRKLWSGDDVSFHGEFFHVEGATIAPKPIQQPGPPVLIGADTLRSISRVPEVGDHWISSRRHSKPFLREAVPVYKEALAKNGKDYKGLLLFRDLCVADSAAEAENRIKEAYERMFQVYRRWGQPGERYEGGFDELKQDRLIVGSPEDVAEQVLSYHQEFGVEFMGFTVHWPGMDPRWTLETIQLFGERVIPELKRVTGRGGLF